MPASISMVKRARLRRDGSVLSSPVHSSSQRSRTGAGSRTAVVASSRRDTPAALACPGSATEGWSSRVPVSTAAARSTSSRSIVHEFAFDRIHPQGAGKPRETLQGFPGLLLLLSWRQVAQRAHVVQPVSQLDHQHPAVTDGLGRGHRLGH